MKKGIITAAVLTAVVAAVCWMLDKKGEEDSSRWDEKGGVYTVAGKGVKYVLPTEASSWAIAQEEAVPPQMDFFGVDTRNEVCVGLFNPEPPLTPGEKGVSAYSGTELDGIIRQLAATSGDPQVVVSEKIDKARERYMGADAWFYVLSRKMADKSGQSDTLSVYYSGYIFDNEGGPYGIVVITGSDPCDSAGGGLLRKYSGGLTAM